jgi:hypothetical protein
MAVLEIRVVPPGEIRRYEKNYNLPSSKGIQRN